MDDLVRRTNEIVNSNTTAASLYIRANLSGSFEIEFLLTIIPVVATSLGNDPLSDANNLIRLLFGSNVPGLFTVIKKLRGRTLNETRTSQESLTIEADYLSLDGVLEAENLRVNVPPTFARLLYDPDIRNASLKLLGPLQQDGIDHMSVRQGDEELERITEDDLASFEMPLEPPDSLESVVHQFLVIDTSRFSTRSRQWRFYDGNRINSYRMSDESFINSVLRREVSISAGDIFECEVRIVQRVNRRGEIVFNQEILRVINRRAPADAGTQSRFDL